MTKISFSPRQNSAQPQLTKGVLTSFPDALMIHLLSFNPYHILTAMFTKLIVSSLFLCLLVPSLSADPAKPYAKGITVAEFKAADQHGKPYTFEKGTRYLLVTFDMSTGKKANKVLAAKGADYLTQKKAVYVANIYGMPGIGRTFALPKMRRYPHTIILADEENLLARFPQSEKKVTVLKLNKQGEILSLSYWDPKTQKIEDVIK
jgi:hypothetical protein